jgi:hypothetical protein
MCFVFCVMYCIHYVMSFMTRMLNMSRFHHRHYAHALVCVAVLLCNVARQDGEARQEEEQGGSKEQGLGAGEEGAQATGGPRYSGRLQVHRQAPPRGLLASFHLHSLTHLFTLSCSVLLYAVLLCYVFLSA